MVLIDSYAGKYIKLVVDSTDPNGYTNIHEYTSTTIVAEKLEFRARISIDIYGDLIDAFKEYSLDESNSANLELLNRGLALLIRDNDDNLTNTPIEEIIILNLVFSSIFIDYLVYISSSVDLENTRDVAANTVSTYIIGLLIDFANENDVGDRDDWDESDVVLNSVSTEISEKNKLSIISPTDISMIDVNIRTEQGDNLSLIHI